MDTFAITVKNSFTDFLQHYLRDDAEQEMDHTNDPSLFFSTYETQLISMLNAGKTTVYVDHSDLMQYDNSLASAIREHYLRFDPYLRQAVKEVVGKVKEKAKSAERALNSAGEDTGEGMLEDSTDLLEEDSLSTYFVAFCNLPTVDKIRSMKTDTIGKLISLCGTVTRSTEVRPELLLGCFVCTACGVKVTTLYEASLSISDLWVLSNPNF